MNGILNFVLIAYVVISYIISIILVFALYNLTKKMKRQGQPVLKVSMWQIVPIALIAPISLPIVLLVVLWFRKKQGM